jgi:hypothetical protein
MKRTLTQSGTRQRLTFAALLTFFMAAAVAASAGSKNVKAEILTPATGTEVNSNKNFTVKVKITNNDMMYPLDKMMDMPIITIKLDGKVVASDTFMLTANVAPGGTATLESKPHKIAFPADKANADLCIEANVYGYTNTNANAKPCQKVAMKVVPTGINDVKNEGVVNIYPNPASDRFTVALPNTANGKLVIYDLAGKAVSAHDITAASNVVSVSGFAAGTYLYRVSAAEGQVYNGKLQIK